MNGLGLKGPVLFAALSLQAVESSHMPAVGDPDFVRWAFTQGGLVVVVLVLVWSYRKDLVAVIAGQREKIELLRAEKGELLEIVRNNSQAMTKLSDGHAQISQAVITLAERIGRTEERR